MARGDGLPGVLAWNYTHETLKSVKGHLTHQWRCRNLINGKQCENKGHFVLKIPTKHCKCCFVEDGTPADECTKNEN